jgi:hypothetical protein
VACRANFTAASMDSPPPLLKATYFMWSGETASRASHRSFFTWEGK